MIADLSNASREQRRELLPLVQQTVIDPDATGPLSDLLQDRDNPLWQVLRLCVNPWGWCAALECGCWRARVRARKLRGIVRQHAGELAAARRYGRSEPAVRRTGRYTVTAPHEWCQDEACPCGVLCIGPGDGRLWNVLRSTRHLRPLIWRGLKGERVTEDVTARLWVVADYMRIALLAKGY